MARAKKPIEDEPQYLAQIPPYTDPSNWIDTGSLTLNAAIGVGFPAGKVIEIYGPSQSRKSTLMCFAFAGAQKHKDIRTCWYSSEEGLPEEVGVMAGIDFRDFRYRHTPLIEDLYNRAGKFCRKAAEDGFRPVWGIDSMSALSTASETWAQGGVGKDFHYNPHSRKIAQGWRTHFGTLVKTRGTAIVISHQKPTGVPGGAATGFFSAVRLMIHPKKWDDDKRTPGEILDENGEVIGYHANIHIVKNRFSKKCVVPWRFYYDYDEPVKKVQDMWDFLTTQGIVQTRGSYKSIEPYYGKSFYAKDFAEFYDARGQKFWDDLVAEFYRDRFAQIYKMRGISSDDHEEMYSRYLEAAQKSLDDEMNDLMKDDDGNLEQSTGPE